MKHIISLVAFLAIAAAFLTFGMVFIPARAVDHHFGNGVQILAILAVWCIMLTIVVVIAARGHHVPRPKRRWYFGKMH
ncbi:MAG: hypothetical protein NTV39_04085 [Candidatus Saccharibacteria bacterium]|nr:hypothetical protein [Candidatus Saccharibacteria bacterium]